MSRAKILEKVNEIFKDVFDDNSLIIMEETTAADVEDWDSLSHITLVCEIEEAFSMKFTMKEVQGMQNVGEMLSIIAERSPK